MSVTIHFYENQSVRLSDQSIETRPPDRVEFIAEGNLTVSEELLGEFEGMSLKPARVGVSVDESQTITVDLTEETSLRLEEVDVGVETPDADNISSGMDSLIPTTDDEAESPNITPGSIAFTVGGAILNVPEGTFEPFFEGSPTLESITFTVDDAVKSDGGSNNDVLLEFTLLGYGIIIHYNGVIDIGTRGSVSDIELP